MARHVGGRTRRGPSYGAPDPARRRGATVSRRLRDVVTRQADHGQEFPVRADVIEASSNFVSVRLMTYESRAEADFLKSVFTGGSGDLENSTFALLSPDGHEQLVRSGRSPSRTFRGAADEQPGAEMARKMNAIAKRDGFEDGKATKSAKVKAPDGLPAISDVRLALNVASCDSMPLVIVFGKTKNEAEAFEKKLTPVAWSDDLRGRFAYVVTAEKDALANVKGAQATARILVVRPDVYGTQSKVLEQLPGDADAKSIETALAKALAAFTAESKDPRQHVLKGCREGIQWETEIPVTDPGPKGKGKRSAR